MSPLVAALLGAGGTLGVLGLVVAVAGFLAWRALKGLFWR